MYKRMNDIKVKIKVKIEVEVEVRIGCLSGIL
jgi:hypothetical protein